jgi:hypothetical protein
MILCGMAGLIGILAIALAIHPLGGRHTIDQRGGGTSVAEDDTSRLLHSRPSSAFPTHPAGQQEPVDAARLEQAIHSSAQYLCRLNNTTGQFIYRINLNENVTPKPRYNMLRHAGTVYALANYHQCHPDSDTLETLQRSIDFLKAESLAPVPGRDDLLAVWCRPEIAGTGQYRQAKLGGAGLGLVALVSVEQIKPGTTPIDDLRRLGRFVLFMQKEDGSFYSKYTPEQGGRSDQWTSLYYPGEATLGLLMLHERDPQEEWLQGASDAMAYLALSRAGRTHVEADHWALLATAKLLARYDRVPVPRVGRDAILAHAVQICESILADPPHFPRGCVEHGGFSPDGRTCPTATRLEGLLAALTFLPEEESDLRERIERSVVDGIAFLLRSQVRSGPHAGAIPRAIGRLPKGHAFASVAFNRRATEVRIDYVQHALSAMLAFHKLAAEREGRTPRAVNQE